MRNNELAHKLLRLAQKIVAADRIYPFRSRLMEKAVEKSNRNGGNIINDGEDYILCAFDMMNNAVAVMKFKSRSDGRNLVKYYKNSSDVALIIVQKGNEAVAHHRVGETKWESRRP